MNKSNKEETILVPIHSLGHNGEGIGKYLGYTIFVEGVLPEEMIECRVFEKKKNYGRAECLKILKPSLDRIEPPCPFYKKCGGCQLMHLSYAKQLEAKRQRVIDALQHVGRINNIPVENCKPSPHPLGYRNKIQLPVRKENNEIVIGLYEHSSHKIVEVDQCLIHCSLGETVYKQLRLLIKKFSIAPYEPTTGQGELRHILIKSAIETEEILVILITNGKASSNLTCMAHEIMYLNHNIKGVVQNINPNRDNTILSTNYQLLAGKNFIHEKIGEALFKISPASFFQVNPQQAKNLYAEALKSAELTGNEIVLDAYCGVGTLSVFFAPKSKQVIGIECIPDAIHDAKENAFLNGCFNTKFICGNAEELIDELSAIDIILLNPPRKGCNASFLKGIRKLRPKKVLYISCDPATLARDLSIILPFGYKIERIQPFDMFPQTAHVETLAVLTLS